MNVTSKEWKLLKQALNEFAANQGIRMSKTNVQKVKVECNANMALSFNLLDRLFTELKLPKGAKR